MYLTEDFAENIKKIYSQATAQAQAIDHEEP